MVFVNSLGTDLRIWDEVVADLGTGLRMLRYDLRGHGLSDAPPAPYSLDDHVGDLAALLDAREIKSAIIVGLSVGGMIAQALASTRPELVRLLVLSDTAHKIGTREMWDARIEAVRPGGLASIAEAVLERWFAVEFRHAQTGRSRGLSQHADPHTGRGLYRHLCDFARCGPDIGRFAADSADLCAWSASEDGATPPDLVRSLAALVAERWIRRRFRMPAICRA